MATPFAHTLRSLEVDGAPGGRALLALAPILLVAWTVWLFAARVQVTESTEIARVQVDAVSREIAASRAGRVSSVRVSIGDRVEAGDLLIELDDRETALALERAEARLESLDAVIVQREREVAASREALEALELAAGAARLEARARVDAALAQARLAESELEDTRGLEQSDVATAAELRRSEAEAERQRAQARERRSASSFARLDGDRQVRDRLARIVAIEGEVAVLAVDRADAQGRIAALEIELEQHRLRAPVAGTVGELAAIERGAWVDRGERLGAVVPAGELEVVAEFSPSQAVGRIKAGQPARLRLAGFPWAEYGSVGAQVSAVAREPRGGAILVELSIESVPEAIALEHGLPGSLEIELERTNPATVLLRAAGRRLRGRGAERQAPAPTDAQP
ncbi:HlyD family secretion protein [Plesiocystis pacifica SIR-1]|uniref:HlyD family secretion protein n=1 Tax=Plesiocystis pacifica SIR-1 TaxID=391625 RepID=A6G9A0_9BACT|nr:HlyD family efflux transporter periplasmic adaptor subunit [Plesiocystis pacifica]EDM77522.1 HlyD family secretion protein [Plesiocystis pacifica SIR-1]